MPLFCVAICAGILSYILHKSNTEQVAPLTQGEKTVSKYYHNMVVSEFEWELKQSYFKGTKDYAIKFATDLGLDKVCIIFKDKQSEKVVKYFVSNREMTSYDGKITKEMLIADTVEKCNADLEAPTNKVYNFEITREIKRVY